MANCIGTPDKKRGKVKKCHRTADSQGDWCEECGDVMMERFTGSWASIAQREAPKTTRSLIKRAIDRILGRR